MNNNNSDEELNAPLSDDPEENLRLENELLQLKLKAEFGATSFGDGEIPPEIEHEFLKNVLAFEHAYAEHKDGEEIVTIYEHIGQPAFIPAGELSDEALPTELDKVIDLLGGKDIAIDFIGEYEDRLKYTFITEELFKKEMGFFSFPGMTTHYTYEEFHPNHKLDIERRAKEFLEHWLERDINEYTLQGEVVLPTDTVLTQKDALQKLQNFFACYTQFEDHAFEIFDIGFELYPETETGMGHAEGAIKYIATLESGEQQTVTGMFKLYLSLKYGWWSICYFVMPGFDW